MTNENQIFISNTMFKNFDDRKRVRFINSLSGIKSANLIGTISSSGQTNLSIVSSAFHLGASPALLGIIIRPDISPRHTLENIRSTKVLTLNHVNENIYRNAHQTSARYKREVSEFEACSLTEEYLENFKAPFVKESHVKVALELSREVSIKENGTHMLILKILGVWIPKRIMNDDGYLNIEDTQAVCVSGLDTYHSIQKLERLPYAKP
ncbi:MAG: flavin oxidoreductase [Halobacteriovorax sp. JY17]|nr:MAG: flavin oxidoreductase [Halobacteriovorax sp. JY17]